MKTQLLTVALVFILQSSTPPPQTISPQQERPATDSPEDLGASLQKVKRIFVETFGDDNAAKQLQAMVINALSESKRFIVTENKEKADAVLKGSALEKTSQELHAIGEGTAVAVAAGGSGGSISGNLSNGTGSISGSHSGGFGAKSLASEDSQASTETINDARLAVRLVDKDGDIIWTTTQESKGAKYKGSSADVADKIVKQLLRDLDKLTKKRDQPIEVEKKP
ncbi:MAG TPA: hypothetical protein VG028_06310 [Terriglobia bacterium]|nr:hypothetical protein [Terriglobia bacterium]